jgi:hypothetical protein
MFNILVPIKTISLSFLLILHNVTIIYYFGDMFSVSISPSDSCFCFSLDICFFLIRYLIL